MSEATQRDITKIAAESAEKIDNRSVIDAEELKGIILDALTTATVDLERQLAEVRTQTRAQVLSWFAWLVGGYNASQGAHPGRLALNPDYSNDEATARTLLDEHTKDLRKERDTLRKQLTEAMRERDQLRDYRQLDGEKRISATEVIQQLRADLAAARKALADAIRRPMGVVPDSAQGLITDADLQAAEERRAAITPTH